MFSAFAISLPVLPSISSAATSRSRGVSDVRSDPETAIGDYPARWSHAHVTGSLPDGGTEQVDLSMLLVALPNGRHFALIELRPDHPGAAVLFPALDRAAASVSAVG